MLWALFSAPSADGSPRLDFRACLLYLCADRDAFSGIKKAFSVATANISSNARANADQVFRIAYPLGAEAGADLHRSPFSKEDVAAVVRAVYDSRKAPVAGAGAAPQGVTGAQRSAAASPAPAVSRGATPQAGGVKPAAGAGAGQAAAVAEEEPTVSAEQLMYSAGGERFVKRMLERYAWKDAFVATRL